LGAIVTSPILADHLLALSPEQACQKISRKLASVGQKECNVIDLALTGALSVNEFPILIKEYPPLGDKKPLGRILLIGGTHGDELSSISVVFKWMNKLEKYHSGKFHWRVVPLLNPDGALLRKHTRQNANGVDLNRNFNTPGAVEQAALDHWKNKTDSNKRRYPGPSPLSEPETQWLFNEISTFKPDVIIAVHAPFSLVDYDAPNRANAPRRIGYLYKNLMGTYPGSLGNFAGIHLEIPVITLELPHSGIMPSKQQISRMWIGIVRWLSRHLKKS
jgi:protein MpaA